MTWCNSSCLQLVYLVLLPHLLSYSEEEKIGSYLHCQKNVFVKRALLISIRCLYPKSYDKARKWQIKRFVFHHQNRRSEIDFWSCFYIFIFFHRTMATSNFSCEDGSITSCRADSLFHVEKLPLIDRRNVDTWLGTLSSQGSVLVMGTWLSKLCWWPWWKWDLNFFWLG